MENHDGSQSSVKSVISRLEKYKNSEAHFPAVADVDCKPQRLYHPNQRTLKLIDWQKRCPTLCWNFNQKPSPLPVVPEPSQEHAVVGDLLLVLTGISGRYIILDKQSGKFKLDEGLESCFVQLAKAVLPLALSYSQVSRFVQVMKTSNSGRVNQAVGAAINRICFDYLAVMARLSARHRASQLNLQSLHSEIQPYSYLFNIISDLCSKIEKDARGGKTLTLLHETLRNSSGKAELLVQHLLETAAVPYMEQLHVWLTQGIIFDPFSEFLIEDNQVIFEKEMLPEEYSQDYWQKCYTLSKDRTPKFLANSAQKILRTGKYLNVLRQCGVGRTGPPIAELRYSCSEDFYTESIRLAHETASSSLLKYLMIDMDLPGHLKSVRNYLLLAQGDFLNKFMFMAAPELDKEIMDIVPSRLQSLLELALRTSSANSDPYKDLLRVELHQETVLSLLRRINSGEEESPCADTRGWGAVAFLYNPPWPVSLVLNRSALTIYQLIFRHLVHCRHVEQLLCRVWLEHKSTELWAAWDLRQRMLLYVNNLEYYMLVEIIEPHWNLLLTRLPGLRDLEQVLECHSYFQSDCLVKCMLTNPKHFKVLNTFLDKCEEFCKFMDACGLVEASPRHAPNVPITEFNQSESFSAKIAEFNQSFTQHVHYLFRTLRDSDPGRRSDKLMDMLYRLDFNSYYMSSVADKQRSWSSSSSVASVKGDSKILSRDSMSSLHSVTSD